MQKFARLLPGSCSQFRPSLAFLLLCALLLVLWVAGGASRADVSGQAVVRAAAWSLLAMGILLGRRPSVGAVRPVALVLLAAVLLALTQLIPLPPSLWQALPGRSLFAEAAAASGQPQPWRPSSIVPGATLNAASSLVVPIATLLFAASLKDSERWRLPGLLLGLIAASMLVGLLQFSGGGFDNPFVNDSASQVSGTFANRNHFALFLSFGCILAPVWAFSGVDRPGWRAPTAIGLVLLFTLMILASGSRAGLVVGILAVAIGLFLVRRGIRKELRPYPRWVFPALIAAIIGLIGIVVLISVASDRAVSISRVFEGDEAHDMRVRGLPTVLAMVRSYFPVGSGLGGFDPMFRIHEPFELLGVTYFVHAHDDFLEIALDAGLPGLVLLMWSLLWWAWASIQAWRVAPQDMVAKAGSAILLLVLVASVIDYPARTPMIMAVIVLAATWLSEAAAGPKGPALPPDGHHL